MLKRCLLSPYRLVPVLMVAFSCIAAAQNPLNSGSAPIQIAPPPPDPFELVTSQPVWTATQETHNAMVALWRSAMQKSAFMVGGVPYTVKISFTAFGPAKDVGAGEMEETRNAAGSRRWTGHLGNFSLVRVITDRMYDTGSSGPIPFRLGMARQAAFGAVPGPMNFIRTADALLNGASVICILTGVRPSTAAGRDWPEAEYCIDSQSGLLRVYSAAPGIYAIYSYEARSNFHGHIVPDQLTIYEAGKIALQGNISVRDPDSLDPGLFTPTSAMSTEGFGLQMPTHRTLSRGTGQGSTLAEPVIVHAMLGPDGSVLEAEALQTPDAPRSQSALELVKKAKYDSTVDYGYPPEQEIFVTVE